MEQLVGYGRPPRAHQFKKGQSGNPKGRPKRVEAPAVHFLDEMVTVEIAGRRRRMRRADWFFQELQRLAETNPAVLRLLLDADERIERAKREHKITCIHWETGDRPDEEDLDIWSMERAVLSLGMGRTLYRYCRTARIMLEPWLVQAALDRWEGPELSAEQQRSVYVFTRCPHQVRWPDWWLPEYRGKARKRGARD